MLHKKVNRRSLISTRKEILHFSSYILLLIIFHPLPFSALSRFVVIYCQSSLFFWYCVYRLCSPKIHFLRAACLTDMNQQLIKATKNTIFSLHFKRHTQQQFAYIKLFGKTRISNFVFFFLHFFFSVLFFFCLSRWMPFCLFYGTRYCLQNEQWPKRRRKKKWNGGRSGVTRMQLLVLAPMRIHLMCVSTSKRWIAFSHLLQMCVSVFFCCLFQFSLISAMCVSEKKKLFFFTMS